MTDFEVTLDLLTRAGVCPIELEEGSDRGVPLLVIGTERGGDKVGGYTGFWTDFEFDERGGLIRMGAWE